MSQSELAQKMNISSSKMSKLINEESEPNINDLVLLSKIFSVSIDELVLDKNDANTSLLENAVKNNKESLEELLRDDASWLTRQDELLKKRTPF